MLYWPEGGGGGVMQPRGGGMTGKKQGGNKEGGWGGRQINKVATDGIGVGVIQWEAIGNRGEGVGY